MVDPIGIRRAFPMSFRYSLNSSTIKPAPLLDKIRVAAAAGYEGLEIWHDDVEAFLATGGTLRDVRHALDDSGLAVPTTIYIKGWGDPAAADYAADMSVVRRRMEHSVALGAPFVIAGPPPQRDVDYPLLSQQYHALLDLGRQYGVRPAFEYLGFVDEVNSLTKALRVIRAADHPDATVVIDPFHDFRGGSNHEAIHSAGEQIAVSHFNDARRSRLRMCRGTQTGCCPATGASICSDTWRC
jgi:sugar phosphate isomerase/epimerase